MMGSQGRGLLLSLLLFGLHGCPAYRGALAAKDLFAASSEGEVDGSTAPVSPRDGPEWGDAGQAEPYAPIDREGISPLNADDSNNKESIDTFRIGYKPDTSQDVVAPPNVALEDDHAVGQPPVVSPSEPATLEDIIPLHSQTKMGLDVHGDSQEFGAGTRPGTELVDTLTTATKAAEAALSDPKLWDDVVEAIKNVRRGLDETTSVRGVNEEGGAVAASRVEVELGASRNLPRWLSLLSLPLAFLSFTIVTVVATIAVLTVALVGALGVATFAAGFVAASLASIVVAVIRLVRTAFRKVLSWWRERRGRGAESKPVQSEGGGPL